MQALAAVPERHGTFTEEKRFAALDRPLVAHGTLDYRRPDQLAKVTTDPIQERLAVDGDRLTVVAGGAAARVFQLGSEPGLRALVDSVLGVLGGNLAVLQAHYRVSLSGTLKGWELVLQPNDAAGQQVLREVRIDGSEATPLRFETVQANGDSQRLTIVPR